VTTLPTDGKQRRRTQLLTNALRKKGQKQKKTKRKRKGAATTQKRKGAGPQTRSNKTTNKNTGNASQNKNDNKTSRKKGNAWQPKVTRVEKGPATRVIGSHLSMPYGSRWCRGHSTFWLVGHQPSDRPWCLDRKRRLWRNDGPAELDYTPLGAIERCAAPRHEEKEFRDDENFSPFFAAASGLFLWFHSMTSLLI